MGGAGSGAVEFGPVGLEEEDEELAISVDGLLEGLGFDAFEEMVAALVPGLGEAGVLVAPVVDGAFGDAGEICRLGDGGAYAVG